MVDLKQITTSAANGAIPFAASGKLTTDVNNFIYDNTNKRFGLICVPATTLDIANKFQVDSNGNILKINNVATSWPASQGGANTYLKNDGSGNFSWAAGIASITWNGISNPDGNQALTMDARTSTWTWSATTGGGVDLFTLTDTLNNTGTGTLMTVATAAGSAAIPFAIKARGGNSFIMNSAGQFGFGAAADARFIVNAAGSSRITGSATSVLTGTITPAASVTVTGVGTLFTTELVRGDRITVSGQTRTVIAIASDLSLTVDTAMSAGALDPSPDKLAAVTVFNDSSSTNTISVSDLGQLFMINSAPKFTMVNTSNSNRMAFFGQDAEGGYLQNSSTLDDWRIGNSSYWLGINGTTGNVMIGAGLTAMAATNALSFWNTAARKIWIENTATDVVGRALTVSAGSTVAGTAVDDVTGGNLILQAGLGTGTGASTISFQTGTTLTTGKTLQTMTTKVTILGNGYVGIGTVGPIYKLDVLETTSDAWAGRVYNSHATGHGLIARGGSTISTYAFLAQDYVGTTLFAVDGLGNIQAAGKAIITGHVGIGTTPSYPLHVSSNNANYIVLFNNANTGTTSYGVVIQTHTTSSASSCLECHNGTSYLLYVRNDGNIGIGTAAPTAPLHIYNSSVCEAKIDSNGNMAELSLLDSGTTKWTLYKSTNASGNEFRIYSSVGGVDAVTITAGCEVTIRDLMSGGTSTVYATSAGKLTLTPPSDRRLKTNIQEISNAIGKINQLKGVTFNWDLTNSICSAYGTQREAGLLAQDFVETLPEILIYRKDGYLGVQYERVCALLVQAIKEQQVQIEELKAKLN